MGLSYPPRGPRRLPSPAGPRVEVALDADTDAVLAEILRRLQGLDQGPDQGPNQEAPR